MLLFAAASTVADRDSPSSFYPLAPFPTSALLAMMSYSSQHSELAAFFLTWTTVVGGGLLLILAFFMRREFRVYSSLEKMNAGGAKNISAG